jgi:outer membrane protein insertion porin family
MNKFKVATLLIFSILFHIALFASEVDLTADTNGVTISSIQFVDDLGKSIETSKFEQYLQLKEGEKLDIDKLINDLENLKEALEDRYPNIEMNIVPLVESEEIEIHYELQKNRVINRVVINSEDANPTDLREKLQAIKGTFLKSSAINADVDTIKNYFHNSGYPFSTVEHIVKLSRNKKKVDITYNVVLNSRELRVRKLNFLGLKSFKKKNIKALMETKAKVVFASKKPYSKELMDQDIARIQAFYKENGFVENKVTYKISKDKNKRYINIDIKIVEGKQLIIRDIEIAGQNVMPKTDILKALKLEFPTAFNLKQQQAALQRVRDLYGENGYALSQVQMNYDEEEKKIKLNIIEGLRQKVLLVEVTGNSKTKKSAILENLKFERGDIVDSRLIKKSIQTLYRTGLFKDVKIDYIPMTATEGKVVVQVVENSTRVIQFSLGSVYGSAGVGASINEGNLFGLGNSLSLSLMVSKELSRLNLIYNDPHLFGTDYQLSTSLSHDRVDSFHYDAKKTAIKVMIEKQITENLKLGLGTRLEFVTPENISNDYVGQIDLSNNKDVITGLISSFGYTTQKHDDEGSLESGKKVSMVLMPSYVNEDFFFKAMTNLTAFRNLGRNIHGGVHQISGRITLGYATEKAPFYEKFRGGGYGTVRGFQQGSITSEDGSLGANASLAANVTYSFPLYTNALSGVIFMDAFTLGSNDFKMDQVRLVGGFGMRANINTGFINDSIEAGITIPLLKKDGDLTKPFYFIFGDYDPAYSL